MKKTKLTIIILLVLATLFTVWIWSDIEYHRWRADFIESQALAENTISIDTLVRGIQMRDYQQNLATNRILLVWLLAGGWSLFLGLKHKLNSTVAGLPK